MSSILDRHRQRFDVDPSDRRAFEALEEAAFVAGDWDDLIGVLQHRLEAPDLAADARERARVLYRFGQAEARRGDDHQALLHWHAAVASDPTCRSALEELRRDANARERWDVALQIADAELALDMASNERAALLAEVGALWLQHFDDAEQALTHFEAALDALPRLEIALEGAAQASERLEQERPAAGYWARLAEIRRGPERATALVAEARLLANDAAQRERCGELYRLALSEEPENVHALDALAEIALRDSRWPVACDLLERRFNRESETSRAAQLALQIGKLQFTQLGNSDEARAWLARAADADPTRIETWELLVEIEREGEDDEALRRALRQCVDRSAAPASLSTLLELAALDSAAGDEEAAARSLRVALDLAPDDALVVEALSDTLARLGEWEELADCLERQAAVASSDPTASAAAYAELAAIQAEQLGDVEAARRSYERAMQAEPSHAGAIAALDSIYRKAESWSPLRTLLEHAGNSGAREARPQHLCALGDLLIERFSEPEAAANAYDAALELDHTCVGAHRGRQQLAQAGDDPDALLKAYENEAAVTTTRSRLRFLVGELTTLYRERERPEAALRWAERWAEVAPEEIEALEHCVALHRELNHDEELVEALQRLDPLLQSDALVSLRFELGELHREHGRSDASITAFQSALEADPQHEATLEALIQLLEAAGQPEELARAHRSLAELSSGERRVRCLDALARLLEERLGDLPQAVDALEQLANEEDAPDDVEDRLEILLERTARHEILAGRLALRAERATGEERTALTLRRAAILLEHMSEFDSAVTAYRELVASDPDCQAARYGLERALRASADPAGLAEFLAEQADYHDDPATKHRFAFERAVILEEVLGASEEAALIYHELARDAVESGARSTAAERLASLFERSEDYEGLRALLEEWLRLSDDPATRISLHDRIGQLCRNRLADPVAATEHLEAAVAADPDSGERWNTLSRIYEELDQPSDLARCIEGQLAADPEMEPAREHALRARVATLCATRLNESDRARDHYERALEIEPSDSAAGEYLIDYWEANSRPDQVARLLELRLGALDVQPRDDGGRWAAQRTSLRLRVAGLRANKLDDPDGAIAVLEPALGEIGPQAAVAEPLADLYQRTGYTDQLVELCGKAADAAEPGLERASWLTRRAAALCTQGTQSEAVGAYERALDESPGDSEIEAALRGLHRDMEAAEPLARLLEAQLARLGGPAEIPVRLELAALFADALDRPHDALLQLRRVVHLDPSHSAALERGLELAEGLNQPQVVRALLDDALQRDQAAAARASLLTRRAGLLAANPETRDAAVADYREALQLAPDRSETRTALRELLETGDQWGAALDCLCEEAYRAADSERASLLERGATLAWQHLSPDAALPWLERLRHERPQDGEVLARIAHAHELAERPQAQLRAIEAESEICDDPARQRALHCARAHVLERDLGWPALAIAAYESAREIDKNDAEVLRELDRLYADAGRDRERAHVLEALVPSTTAADRTGLLRDAAALCRGSLADPREAARLLLRAVAETRSSGAIHGELLRELADALKLAGPPDAWARCAEAELAALDAGEEVFAERRLRVRQDLAAYYQRTGCLDSGIRHLNALVDEAPPEFDPTCVHEAALLYALRCEGNSVELERRTTARLERTGGDAEAWLELARLRDEGLSATARSADAYRRAVAFPDAGSAAIRGARSTAERLSRWEEVAAMLELELERDASLAPAARAALLRRLGDVCWEKLGSTTRASRAYAGAIEAWPEDFAAHRALELLLETMEDWRGAVDHYESEIDVLGEREPERRQAAWLRAGELSRDRMHETQRALRAYVAAAELGELALASRKELAELHLACGETDAFSAVFASWCDDPANDASGGDHLRLAETLEQLGRHDDALSRCEHALEVGASDADAWLTAARLRETAGSHLDASSAWERAAEASGGSSAAEAWRRAAALRLEQEPEAAASLLRKAVLSEPAVAAVQADLADAASRIESWAEAETAALHALDAMESGGNASAEIRLAVALLGATAAREQDKLPSASDFYHAALAADAHCAEALAGSGECLAALQEWASARQPLLARLAHELPDPDAAAHRALLARCAAETGDADTALSECEAALELDATQADAHTLCVSLHEAADRVEPGIAALERWAANADDTGASEQLLRAALWELRAGDRVAAAQAHLLNATERDPQHDAAWRHLAELYAEQDLFAEAAAAADAGLAANPEPENRAALCLVSGRSHEATSETEAAREAYAAASAADPRCLEAALAEARLLRAAGQWRDAAEALGRFADAHPGDDPVGLAEALQQRARLLAGPLEDIAGAVADYRRAIAFHPERHELRVTLASLFSQRPDAWPEALEQYAATLAETPADAASLRAVLRIAEHTDQHAAISNGRALLLALGIATPEEAAAAPATLELQLAPRLRLDSERAESLRAAVQCAADDIGRALGAPSEMPPPAADCDAVASFRAAALKAQADLTAPGLLPLPTDEMADVVRCVTLLSLEPDTVHASGATLNAIAESFGRRSRRRVKRALGDMSRSEIEAFDFENWRHDLRALAAAHAVDSGSGDLRAALVAGICNAEDRSPAEFESTRDICAQVATSEQARGVLERAVRAWLAQIAP